MARRRRHDRYSAQRKLPNRDRLSVPVRLSSWQPVSLARLQPRPVPRFKPRPVVPGRRLVVAPRQSYVADSFSTPGVRIGSSVVGGVCASRAVRREVLFAFGRTGKGSARSPRRKKGPPCR